MSGAFARVRAVTQMNLRTIPLRWGSSMVIVIGVAGTMAVLLSVLAVSSGLRQAMQEAGRPDRAIVLRSGSAAELGSSLSRSAVRAIESSAGVRRNSRGTALVSPESMSQISVVDKRSGSDVNVTLRGLVATGFEVRPEINVIEGRRPTRGLAELIVGRAAREQFGGLSIGDTLETNGLTWTIVGVFESGGNGRESELIGDAELLIPRQSGAFQSALVMLQSASSLAEFERALTSDPTLAVDVYGESQYLARQSASVQRLLFFMAYVVGGIMAIGAVFAAINSMYTSVSTRTREIAILRAIGFGGRSVMTSVLVEALVLAVTGCIVGTLLAWLVFSGDTISTAVGTGLPSQMVFRMTLTWKLFAVGLALSCLIALVGALLPALRAAHLPVTEALRSL